MLAHLVVAATALIASGLTLFSGFGLGTILMPVFALFFPIEVAVAATAVVHLANNLFKVVLVGRHANWSVLLRFAPAAAFAAMAGAWLLGLLANLPAIARYDLFGETREINSVKLTIGVVIVIIALLELSPRFSKLAFPPNFLVLGGLVSGFFGGLSGNQGAFRSAFLLRAGLDKEAFVATGVIASVIVDTFRLAVYGLSFARTHFASLGGDVGSIVVVAIIAAFIGAYVGARLLKKVTLRFVQFIVAAMMVVIGLGLATGLL